MNRAAGVPESGQVPVVPPCLPADRVLDSGAVVCPGGFDRHGCPLVLFPVDGHDKLSSHISKEEAVDFIHYCLHLYSQKQPKVSQVSLVVDLRDASPKTAAFVGETLRLLQLRRATVHTAYIVDPRKRDGIKLVQKLLSSKSFKKVVVKDVAELSVYIDRSQLPVSLGGYLVYSHRSWVDFMKEIEGFVQDFLSVVQRLPACTSTLQALSTCPSPTNHRDLHHFCNINEAKVQQLRRELGLDELLRRCEAVMEKLRFPEKDPCFQAMAGTALFTQTASEMLLKHSRLTAAVEKVDYLLQQVFSKARVQLRVLQLREDALQITEQVEKLLDKLAVSPVKIAANAVRAEVLVSEYEASFFTPATALVRCAEDVIHTLEEILPLEGPASERWVLDLEKLKDELHAAVQVNVQTLRAVCTYHRFYGKASSWYKLILGENLLEQLLSNVNGKVEQRQQQSYWRTVPGWRQKLTTFLTKNPPPEVEELVHLTHLSNLIPDGRVQQAGTWMSERCMTLRKLLISDEPVTVDAIQLALQWQNEFLQSNQRNVSSEPGSGQDALSGPDGRCRQSTKATSTSETHTRDYAGGSVGKELIGPVGWTPCSAAPGLVLTRGKPSSLCSFDSGLDEVGGGQLELGGRESLSGIFRITRPPQFHPGNLSSVCDSEEYRVVFGSRPKASMKSLNFDVKVTRSVELPSNPWLSLPVDDLENSYTVAITPNPPSHRDSSGSNSNSHLSNGSHGQSTQTAGINGAQSRGPSTWEWILQSQSSFEDPELSPVCDILSSNSTDTTDQFTCTTEGTPTSLWDSCHLHEQSPDSADGVTLQKDWDVKEQQSLQEVEKILEKTHEILEEEENVLAQEMMLDGLLRSESLQRQSAFWDGKDQPGRMSSHDLAEAGVLHLEDLVPGRETQCARGAAGPEGGVCGSEGSARGAAQATVVGTQEPLPMRKEVHLKDLPNMEENVEINKLRNSEEHPEFKGRCFSKLQQEEDVERTRIEEELDSRDEVKPENMESSVLENSGTTNKGPTVLSDTRNSVVEPSGLEKTPKEPNIQVTEKDSNRPSCSNSQEIHMRCDEKNCAGPSAELSAGTTSLRNSLEAPKELKVETPGFLSGRKLDGEVASLSKPEGSMISALEPDSGEFDPRGRTDSPLVLNPSVKQERPQSTDLTMSTLSEHCLDTTEASAGSSDLNLTLRPNMIEHGNKNNNNNRPDPWTYEESGDINTLEMDTRCGSGTKDFPDHRPTEQVKTSPPNIPPLKFDPGGWELDEDVPDCLQSSGTRRTSLCGSPEIQVHGSMMLTDFKTPLVMDMGSGLMKAGFADQDVPTTVLPMMIGTPKYEEVMNCDLEKDVYVGHEAQHMRGVLVLKHPMKNGIIQNWDDMEKIWHHTFQQLRVNPEDHPVLLTEAAMNPASKRERLVEMMFECFNVPFTYVAMQAVLALYSAGRSTGLVFDSGDGVSHCVPVFEGYTLPHAIQRVPLAGADVTMQLKKLLQEGGISLSTSAELEIVREMKERCCFVALDPEAELVDTEASCREVDFSMPDGQVVTLHSERFRAPEILFKPELIGRDHPGVHESIFKSVFSSDIDLRRHFLENIVLSGGNTLLPGLPERLQAEIRGLLPGNMKGCVHITSPKDREFSVWRGGAVLAALPTFSGAWISRDEYEESGPQIVGRKCF